MKYLLFFLMSMAIVFISCGDDDLSQEDLSYTDIEIITGLDLFDINGQPMGRWKDPNHNPGQVACFPNPSTGVISIYSQETISRIWLVPSECYEDKSNSDLFLLSQDLSYSIPEIDAVQIIDIPVSNFDTIASLDFSNVPTSFYKIFYQMQSGEIYWRNLYIDPNLATDPGLFLDDLCN